jgi:6-phosphogluconolactonase
MRMPDPYARCLALLLPVLATAACGSSKDAPDDATADGGGGVQAATGGTGSGGHAAPSGSGGASGASGSGGARDAGTGGSDSNGGMPQDAGHADSDGAVNPGTDAGMAHDAAVPSGTPFVYVSGGGPDITYFKLDLASGALAKQGSASGGTNPSYLAVAPDKKHLYAINEADGGGSQVIAFSIDGTTGALSEINRAPTSGQGAPHLAVHPTGKWLAVAHYNSGHTSILPIRADGGVQAAVDVKLGPNDDCKNAHQAVFDSTGAYLFVPCLGSNFVQQFKFGNGMLTYNDPATVAVPGGPRHMAFDAAEQRAYVLSELESKITSFSYDAATGKLSGAETINSYETTAGSSAHIVVHPSGQWLYASNRTENSIGLFSIDAAGKPHAVAFEHDMIATPRDFTVDPTGRWLISCNQAGAENVLVFGIAPADGRLTRAQVVPVGGSPSFAGVVFLP